MQAKQKLQIVALEQKNQQLMKQMDSIAKENDEKMKSQIENIKKALVFYNHDKYFRKSEIIDDKQQIIANMEKQFEQQSEAFVGVKYLYDTQVQKVYEKCSVKLIQIFLQYSQQLIGYQQELASQLQVILKPSLGPLSYSPFSQMKFSSQSPNTPYTAKTQSPPAKHWKGASPNYSQLNRVQYPSRSQSPLQLKKKNMTSRHFRNKPKYEIVQQSPNQ